MGRRAYVLAVTHRGHLASYYPCEAVDGGGDNVTVHYVREDKPRADIVPRRLIVSLRYYR